MALDSKLSQGLGCLGSSAAVHAGVGFHLLPPACGHSGGAHVVRSLSGLYFTLFVFFFLEDSRFFFKIGISEAVRDGVPVG